MLSSEISVEAQTTDPNSILSVYKKFAAARNAFKALAKGEMTEVTTTNNAAAIWTMSYDGQSVLVVHNFGDKVITTQVNELSSSTSGKVLVSIGGVSVNAASVTMGPFASAVIAL